MVAFVKKVVTFCKYQLEKGKLLKAESQGSEDHASHTQRAATLHPGDAKTEDRTDF